MRGFIYMHHTDTANMDEQLAELMVYAERHQFDIAETILDDRPTKTHWKERSIGQLIFGLQPHDRVIVYDAPQLACSTSQILEILGELTDKQAHIHFIKYNACMENTDSCIDTQHLLKLIGKIESDFISKRTMQALAKRKAAGLPLGRPKGRGNKSLKLDRHQEDIKKYLSLGISKASIAKLVGCHPQTLYDWLERNRIDANGGKDATKKEPNSKNEESEAA